ncbi:CwfJ C-terminus 1-domain-containing protein-like protein [Syncephalis fuscata]|nr:CwfJ C-terminus 1-domain-containing protein-like protein [Syncephalis fuscata]
MLEVPEELEGFGAIKRELTPPPPPPIDEIKVSDRELNTLLVAGTALDAYPEPEQKAMVYGDDGSSWRMLKLKRTLELADEEKRPLKEVAIERYGSTEDFEQAMSERKWLDQRTGSSRMNYGSNIKGTRTAATSAFRRPKHHYGDDDSEDDDKDSMTDSFGRQRRPGESTTRRSPSPPPQYKPSVRPSVAPMAHTTHIATVATPLVQCMSQNELNRLQARVLRARMLGTPDADALEAQYKMESEKAKSAGDQHVIVLTEAELRGRRGIADKVVESSKTNKRPKIETHDQQGMRIKYGHAGEDATVEELVREERTGTTNDYHKSMVKGIARDSRFQDDLDYMDEQADKLAARVSSAQSTTQQVRRDAIGNYQRAQKAMEQCHYCFRDGRPPTAPLISLGHRAYLALPPTEPLVPGHCLIVPVQHQLSMLECEDDVWTEVRNFMKCLLHMFHAEGRGCIFMETVMNLDWHRHTVIECLPMPEAQVQDAPAYFKEAILASDEEWTQHRKLYDTRKNGFRHTMTPRLPYFHVWFTLDGGMVMLLRIKNDFHPILEIIGGILDLLPQTWRKPRRITSTNIINMNVANFKKNWATYDWTAQLET